MTALKRYGSLGEDTEVENAGSGGDKSWEERGVNCSEQSGRESGWGDGLM